MSKKPADQLIQEYCAAYVAANGKALHSVWYDHGWFKIRNEAHGYITKYRRKTLEHFVTALRRRAAEAAP